MSARADTLLRPGEQPPISTAPGLRVGPYVTLDVLGRGAMGVVYRAERAGDGRRVALKTITGVSEANLAGLRREIHALGRLRHPGVVGIVEQGIHDGLPWLAMELVEGRTVRACFDEMPHAPRPFDDALALIGRVCEPLAHIHAHGIVHGDLKPENVQIGSDGSAVLVDFGLFSHAGHATGREVLEVGGVMAGTDAYIAPERVRGELVDARADLYALGCMLYEAITGAPPFAGRRANEVLYQHLHVEPRPPSAVVPGVPPWLDALVLELLRKSRRERLGYADVVAARLRAHLGPWRDRAEVARVRSYLYRPEFVGRDDVMPALTALVRRAARGEGGLVFVAGESGIGKTRLVMEVGTTANACAMAVVVGECVAGPGDAGGPRGGAAPLQAFRPLLSAVADRCRDGGRDVTERLLGARGPVLAAYEPAIAALPGQSEYPPPPAVSPEAALARLQRAVVDTLAALASATPLALVLDDLQWADELSLHVMRALQAAPLAQLPLLVVATYRSEDTDAALAEIVAGPATLRLELERLPPEGIRRMVGDMLALPAPPEFVGSLFAHTEGNPFFVSEYLHAAVDEELLYRDEMGRWRLARAEYALPIPRGLQDLIGHRLDRLAPEARALVEVASVLGQSFDEALLMRAARLADTRGMEAAQALVERRLLVREAGGTLAFGHGKIREVAYAGIADARRVELHEEAARALDEHLRGRDATPYRAALAQHWSIAAQRAEASPALLATAVDAVERAADQALRTDASRQAIRLFAEALHLQARLGPDARREARWESGLGEASFRLGRAAEARDHLVRALRRMGERIPAGRFALGRALLCEVSRQAVRRVRRRMAPGRAGALEVAHAYELLGFVQLLMTDQLPALVSNLRSLNAAEAGPPSAVLANASAVIGLSAGSLLGDRLASPYFARALAAARALGDDYSLGRVAHLHALYLIGRARWEDAERALDEAMGAFVRIGDGRWRDMVVLTVGNLHYHHRRSGGLAFFQEGARAGGERGDLQTQAWSALGLAATRLVDGATADVLAHLETMDRALSQRLDALADRASELGAHGVRAAALFRLGRHDEARTEVERAHRLMRDGPSLLYYAYAGYALSAEVSLRLWEGDGGERQRLRAIAAAAIADLRGFARFVPIGRPQARICEGLAHWLVGRRRRAHASWRCGLETAIRLDMPYEEALARYEIGRHLPAGDPARAPELQRACELFGGLGAVHECRAAEDARSAAGA